MQDEAGQDQSTDSDEGRDMGAALARLDGLDRIREAAAGTPAYLVGGAVRDLLLGDADRVDIDVVVEGDVAPVAERLGGDTRSHERFGTVKVAVGALTVDLTAARTES
jgi:tRNA nucleotidyltransferase/poly(A) polymerase